MRINHISRSHVALALSVMLSAAASVINAAVAREPAFAQDSFPSPPSERALVYIADEKNGLAPLPFEVGATPLRTEQVAGSNKRSYVELKGEHAATVIANDAPHLYLFVPDRKDVHPPFLVRLTEKRGARRVTALAQKNLRGFAIASEEIVKPRYRVLAREGGMLFMEVRAREPLIPGEYAVIGADLTRIATFRVSAASNPE